MYTDLPALTGHLLAVFVDQPVILYTTQYHIAGKDRGIAQTHRQSPFAIESDHNGYTGHLLRLICELGLILHQTSGKEEPPNLISLHGIPQQGLILFGLHRSNRIHKQLSHLFLQTEGMEYRIDPLPALLIPGSLVQDQRLDLRRSRQSDTYK